MLTAPVAIRLKVASRQNPHVTFFAHLFEHLLVSPFLLPFGLLTSTADGVFVGVFSPVTVSRVVITGFVASVLFLLLTFLYFFRKDMQESGYKNTVYPLPMFVFFIAWIFLVVGAFSVQGSQLAAQSPSVLPVFMFLHFNVTFPHFSPLLALSVIGVFKQVLSFIAIAADIKNGTWGGSLVEEAASDAHGYVEMGDS